MKRQWKKIKKRYVKATRKYGEYLPLLGICVTIALLILVGVRAIRDGKQEEVYAAAGHTEIVESAPTGINGALIGVMETRAPKDGVKRIGTSCEEVIVGQRSRKVEKVGCMNASAVVKSAVENLRVSAELKSAQSTIMSDEDYETLLAIVEAEAGGEDLKGRIMVANVIMNRVANSEFPDCVYDVVYEVDGGAPQFSPTADGRIYTVTISDVTVEAVKAALEGTDYSEGALFFVAKEQADQDNVNWFDTDLTFLFQHGVHSFYTYPELTAKTQQKDQRAVQLVSMVR